MDYPLYIAGPRRPKHPRGPEEWGTPMPLLHRSIADIPEKEFVAHVLSDPHYRSTLLNIKGLDSSAHVLHEVALRRFRRRLDWDIDVLVIPRSRPAQATAI